MLYRVINTAIYPKRLILNSRVQLVKGKHSVDLDLSSDEATRLHRSPDLLLSELDNSSFAQVRNKSHVTEAKNPDFYTGRSASVAPAGEPRPLYEQIFAEIFGLKNRMTALEVSIAAIEVSLTQPRGDGNDKLSGIMSEIINLQGQIEEIKRSSAGHSIINELLNMETNPQEARRFLFEKIVEKNKEFRN